MARGVLGILLLAMAVAQASDLAGFVDILTTYRLGGGSVVALAVALLLVSSEIAAGLGLLGRDRRRRRAASVLAIAVALVWSVLALQAFARGLALDNCGCFGVHLGQSLRWWILLEDAQFVALAVWVGRRQPTRRGMMAASDRAPAAPGALVDNGGSV